MLTDCFFVQGVSHEICEDYAIKGDDYIILSDGCSNGTQGGIDSDWGSRILCKAAEQHIFELWLGVGVFVEKLLATAKSQVSMFPNISKDCLTATLVVLKANHDGKYIRSVVFGDGVVGGRKKDGTWQIFSYDYLPGGTTNCGAPYYLKYQLENEVDRYIELFGGTLCVTEFNGDINGEMEKSEKIVPFNEFSPHSEYWFDTDEFDFVFCTSDGSSSFFKQVVTETSKYRENIELIDSLRVILNATIPRPGFFKLKRQWAFTRKLAGTFKSLEWQNFDDLSVGGIFPHK